MIPLPLDAVIFDMDGLLLDTETPFRAVLFDACAAMGFEMTHELHRKLIGTPNEAGHAILADHFGADFRITRFKEHCAAGMARHFGDGVAPKPGARELLTLLKERSVPRGLATSTGRRLAEDHLRKAGIFELLDVLVTRNDVTRGKPHPETFLRAAELLGARPSHCLALEDSHNGIRAASAAGMATIMVPDLLPATDEIRELCVAVMDSLDEVKAAITASGAG